MAAMDKLRGVDNDLRNLDATLRVERRPSERFDALMRQYQALQRARAQLVEISNLLA
jgi:hypothetical protein